MGKQSNKPVFYKWLAIIGLAVWVAETAYFGWNDTPQGTAERLLDALSFIAIVWGVIGDILTNVTIVKNTKTTYHETHTVNAQTVEFAPRITNDTKVKVNGKNVADAPAKATVGVM